MAALGGRVKEPTLKLFGEIILGDEGAPVIVGIFIIFSVAEVFHQAGWCVADVQRYRQGAGLTNNGLHLAIGGIGAVARYKTAWASASSPSGCPRN